MKREQIGQKGYANAAKAKPVEDRNMIFTSLPMHEVDILIIY